MCLCIVLFVVFTSGRFSSTQLQKQASKESDLQPAIKPTPATLPNQGSVTQTNPQPRQDITTQGVASKQTNIVPVADKATPQLPPKATVAKTDVAPTQVRVNPEPSPKSDVPKAKMERGKKMVKIKVKQGDSFIMLIKDFYGRTDKQVLALVKSKNTHIKDFHNLREGNILYFPNPSDMPQ